MKQFLLSSIFILLTITAFTQNYRIDEKRIFSYDSFNSQWEQNVTEQFSFNDGGNKEYSITGLQFPGGEKLYRFLKSYDANNNIITNKRQIWNSISMQWEDQYQDTYTYYMGTDNVKDVTTYNFSSAIDISKELYEYSGGYITKITFQEYNGNVLENTEKYEYTYNSSNQPIKEDDYSWNTTTNMWDLSERGTATYSSGLREFIVEKYNGSTWDLYERYLTYFSGGIETEHIQQSRIGAVWEYTDREKSNYDANGNKIEYTFYSWQSGTWEPYYKEEQSFSDALGINLFDKAEITVFPNPASVSVKIISSLPVDKIEIFNVLGHKVTTVLNTNTVDVERLETGIYLMKFFRGTRSVSRKIMIN